MTRLRYEPVELKECVQCHELYEGDSCPLDRTPFNPQAARRKAALRLIVAGVDPEVYLPELRLVCKGCGNLYELPKEWRRDDPWAQWEAVRTAKQLLRSAGPLAEQARAEDVTVEKLRARIERALDSLRCPQCDCDARQRPVYIWQRQPPRRHAAVR